MINLSANYCGKCSKVASFNYEGLKPKFCVDHKLEGMIDIKNKKCLLCDKSPIYNFPKTKTGIYCQAHRLNNMVNVVDKKCGIEGCGKIPNFGDETGVRYCFTHKELFMKDIRNKLCNICFLARAIPHYDDKCQKCFIKLHPSTVLYKNYKIKEMAVFEFIKETFPLYDWVSDKRIQNSKSKYRPDIFLEREEKNIIIEIDEILHYNYSKENESKRITQLFNDGKEKPLVVIRFNPDNYGNVKSCWYINLQGTCVLREKNNWNNRLNILKNEINHWLNKDNIPKNNLSINFLFYE